MSDHGLRYRPPQAPGGKGGTQVDDPKALGGSVEGDRQWAQQRIRNFLGANRAMRKVDPAKESEGGEAQHADAAQVSQPGEPAEKEADAVADHVADKLHGGEAKSDQKDAAAPKEAAPAIGAKLAAPSVMLKPKPAPAPPDKAKAQKADQRKHEQGPMPAEPVPRETPHKPLSDTERVALEAKKEARQLTKEEHERLEWDRRMGNARGRGVDRFWREEQKRLMEGKPSRKWSPEQKEAIMKGEAPKGPDGKPMEGHHLHNVAEFPQHAANPANVTAVTKKEHLEKWHGGNFQNETRGKPNKPGVPNEF